MKLWPFKTTKAKKNIDIKAFNAPGQLAFFDADGNLIRPLSFSDKTGAVQIPAFNQAVSIIVNSLLQLPITLNNEEGPIDPLPDIVINPNSWMGAYETRQYLYEKFVRYGDAFAIKTVTGGIMPAELKSYDLYTDKRLPNRVNPRYELRRLDETTEANKKYTPKEIFHIKGQGFNGAISFNPTAHSEQVLQPLLSLYKLILTVLMEGSSIRDLIQIDNELYQDLDEQGRLTLYNIIQDIFQKRDAVGVLPAGASIAKRDAVGLIDQTLLSLEEKEIENVGRIFNLSPRYLFISRNIRVSQELEAQNEDLLRLTLSPYIKSIENAYNSTLTQSQRNEGIYYQLDQKEYARGTMSKRVNIAKELYMAGLASLEEAREYIGFPREMEGQPAPLMPGQSPNQQNQQDGAN